MDDLDTTIDGVATSLHTTEGGTLVVKFPDALPDAKVTVDLGGVAYNEDMAIKLAAGILTTVRALGYLGSPPTNPQHPDSRRPDPMQGYASN